MSVPLVPVYVVDPETLDDDNLILRYALVAKYRYDAVQEHGASRVIASGWPAHEQDLDAELGRRGLASEARYAAQVGGNEWMRGRIVSKKEAFKAEMAAHAEEWPKDVPYRRPYPHASWAMVGTMWYASIADGLDIFVTDECGNRIWRGEEHLEGCDQRDHPYYERRRRLIDAVREMPGFRE